MGADQTTPPLLERARHLAVLSRARAGLRGGQGGALVLVDGEAGGGKTSLVRRFRDFCEPPRHILWGACDPLFTPRPLGPFVEIAQEAGGEIAELVAAGGKPHQLAAAIVRAARSRWGTILVLEDLHWADEATLDVLSLLGRRIESVPALMIATYRGDELDRGHPLRRLLGELHGGSVRRLTVEPLSAGAVRTLAEPYGRDAAELHRATAGNPFFVTEVLAENGDDVPATVRDAVLARTARLSAAATTVAEAVSVTVPHAELWLLEALAADAAAAGLEPCLRAGILRAVPGGVAFRHEIARITVEESLSPHRRLALHRAALRALAAPPSGGTEQPATAHGPRRPEPTANGAHGPRRPETTANGSQRSETSDAGGERPDPGPPETTAAGDERPDPGPPEATAAGPDQARLAHHAEAAGDTAAVLRHAPAAARHAASIGAHREAAAQYARALRAGGALPPGARADLLEKRSYECYLTDQTTESIDVLREAIRLRQATGDRLGEAIARSSLSRRLWCGGHSDDAAAAGREAVRLLERLPPGRELALAYSNLAQIHLNEEDVDATIAWATRALDLAEATGEPEVIVHSLNNLGTIRLLAGRPDGAEQLERSLVLAERAGLEEHIGRAYIHFGWAMTRTRAYHLAGWLDRGVAACEDLGLEAWKHYVVAYRARVRLDQGRWDDALADATLVLRTATSVPLLRILTLTVIGLVHARRGDRDPWPMLDEVRALIERQTELQYLAPVAAARAEAAWLAGDRAGVDAATRDVLGEAIRRRAGWVSGELSWLRRLAGLPVPEVGDLVPAVGDPVPAVGDPVPAVGAAGPYAAQLAGDAGGAAGQWDRLDCPYDAALALAGSEEEAGLRRALAAFQRLHARPAVTIVTRRLRERGVLGIPRGPQTRTRANPADLTRREVEVLALLREGLSNVEIAGKLFLSTKTVAHHVSAILRKLGVARRGQAAAQATRLGLPTAPQI